MWTGPGDTEGDRGQGTSLGAEKPWRSLPWLCLGGTGPPTPHPLPHMLLSSAAFLALPLSLQTRPMPSHLMRTWPPSRAPLSVLFSALPFTTTPLRVECVSPESLLLMLLGKFLRSLQDPAQRPRLLAARPAPRAANHSHSSACCRGPFAAQRRFCFFSYPQTLAPGRNTAGAL